MCNSLHEDEKKIPKSGKGYKLFGSTTVVGGQIIPHQLVIAPLMYTTETSGWVTWIPQEFRSDGFCFFLSLRKAQRVLNLWRRAFPFETQTIIEIQYKEGLGKHIETGFVNGQSLEISLCKKFKPVRIVSVKEGGK